MAKKKKNKRNEKVKKQIKDTFILTVIICILAFTIFKIISLISNPTDTFVLRKSTISHEESKVGYVIREEYIIYNEENERSVKPVKNEGERVAAKQPVLEYYNVNEEELSTQIAELNSKIQEALVGRTDLFPNDVKVLEGQIEKQLDKLKKENSMQNIIEYKSNINEYIVKKAKIAGSLSAAGSYINGLISERNQLETTLSNGAEYVNSSISGVVSYRIDGLEDELKIENMENISLQKLKNLNFTTGQIVGKNTNGAKVINNFECYIAVGFDKKDIEYITEGKKATLRLSTQEEVPAKVYKVKEEGNDLLVIFKITDGVEHLINYRKISLNIIWWSYTGLVAPKSSIIYENGVSYVLRKKNESSEKIIVKIIKENDNYCIIGNYDTEELLEMGYSADEIKKMKTVKLYDEIIVNPDLK